MLLAACLIATTSWASAQVRVTGTVVSAEDGQPVVGASVIVPGTKVGVVTDMDGRFTLNVPEGEKRLRVSSIGMEPQEIQAKDNQRIVLQGNASALDEVVVTGYGNFKKSSFTGAAATVSTEKLTDVPSVSLEDKLAGSIPGVSIAATSGQPGAATNITIRGMGSINAGNDPLIVIDGTPVISGNISGVNGPDQGYNDAGMNVLSTINSNDIASMTVIKDAAAASLYGSRAANGVIVITTKSGSAGKTKVDFRGDWGFSNIAVNYRPTLGGDEKREFIWYGLKNYAEENGAQDGTDFANKNIGDLVSKPENGYTDWRKLLTKNGSHQNYQVSVSGGNTTTRFYSSLSYTKQEGITPNSGMERFSGNANVSHTFGRFKIDFTTLFSKIHQSLVDEGSGYASPIFNFSVMQSPFESPTDKEGNYVGTGLKGVNPLFEYQHSSDKTNLARAYNTLALEWNIWDALKLRGKIAYDYNNSTEDVLWDKESNNGGPGGVMQRWLRTMNTLNTQTQLTYIKTFGKHNVDALLGFETEEFNDASQYESGDGYPGNLYELSNAETTSAASSKDRYRMTSFLGRVNYNYDNLYYLGVSYRKDGSSRLARENRWGNFWSVSGAWRFGGESFMNSLNKVLTDAKLRVSYGVNGTLPSTYYSYMNLAYGWQQYYNKGNGMGIQFIGDKNLSWEQNKALNLGLDLTFWNRLNVTFDYYIRNTSGLIMNRPLSYIPGYYTYIGGAYSPSSIQNIGKMKNEGFELTLQSTNIQTKDLLWTTTFNISHNKNTIKELAGTSDKIIDNAMIHEVGKPYYSYYTREYAGVDPNTGNELYYLNDGTEHARETTTDDTKARRVNVGKHDPDVEGGLTNFLKWKFIDFNFTLTYSIGGNAYNSGGGVETTSQYVVKGATPEYWKDMWKKPGDRTDIPKFVYGQQAIGSSRFLMPTDYLRVKNLSLGFTLPQIYSQKVGLSKARIYFSTNNLLTWKSDRLLVDPEMRPDGYVGWETPALRTYTFGVELSF